MDRVAQLEQKAADLYAHYATMFENDAELHALFLRMKREEVNHKSQVLLQKRLLGPSQFDPLIKPIDLKVVDATTHAIEKYIEKESTDIEKALDFAILLEGKGIESAYRGLLSMQNSNLAKLAKAITAGDEQHLIRLKEMRERYLNRRPA
ncbi:MAG: hypothetical protein JXR76_03185 [Deltaproteobacteria bacterium]|nr:hypothetical protein [Deltaproteobacteria bacterium]